ncbi:MAG: FG-GAP-like repeat-containing protein [Bacteroidota bacterium]
MVFLLSPQRWLLSLFLFIPLGLSSQSFELVQEFSHQSQLTNSTGVAVADYDLDGDLDLYLVASEVFDPNNEQTWSRLLRNEGGEGFTDVTQDARLINWQAQTRDGTNGAKMGASWGDYDNDGYPDIFLSNYGLDELWHNEGDGTFRNVSQEMGVEGCFYCYSSNAVWWDYDLDGDLDLTVSDWIKPNRMYRNDGAEGFTDISEKTRLNDKRHTFSCLPIDQNGDGWLDLYIINDNSDNRFLRNKGNDVFVEITGQIGLTNNGNGMGVDVCDVNNDGLFDIYVTNIFSYLPNPFFVKKDDGRFTDQAESLRVHDTGWGWGARFFDVDHDGDEDLYVVNGFDSPVAEGDQNRFFLNASSTFEDISEELGVDDPEKGMGLEVFDMDMDGDLDMVLGNRDAHAVLYRHAFKGAGSNANWIQIQLEGTRSNKNAFGATLAIHFGERVLHRYHSGVNLFGQSIKAVHVGLAEHHLVDRIQVDWPGGLKEVFGPFAANQFVDLVEGNGTRVIPETPDATSTVFPTPFQDQLWLRLGEDIEGDISLRLTDIGGKTILKETYPGPFGKDLITPLMIDPLLSPGFYLYHILGEGIEKKGKLLKQQ